jgi:hypothetical protein
MGFSASTCRVSEDVAMPSFRAAGAKPPSSVTATNAFIDASRSMVHRCISRNTDTKSHSIIKACGKTHPGTDNEAIEALSGWEPGQVALDKMLLRQGAQTGDFLLFGPGQAARLVMRFILADQAPLSSERIPPPAHR